MYLRIKRKPEGSGEAKEKENDHQDQEMIIYDNGSLLRRFKRCKVDDEIDKNPLFENCLPLKTIYCPLQDLLGHIIIPQAMNKCENKISDWVDREYLYYELEPDREAGIHMETESWIFQPLVNDSEGEESCYELDEEDSNAEGYFTNEYPDEYNDTYGSSCSLYNNFDPEDYNVD